MICKESVYVVFIVFVLLHSSLFFVTRKYELSYEQTIIAMLLFDMTYLLGLPLTLSLFGGVC